MSNKLTSWGWGGLIEKAQSTLHIDNEASLLWMTQNPSKIIPLLTPPRSQTWFASFPAVKFLRTFDTKSKRQRSFQQKLKLFQRKYFFQLKPLSLEMFNLGREIIKSISSRYILDLFKKTNTFWCSKSYELRVRLGVGREAVPVSPILGDTLKQNQDDKSLLPPAKTQV